VGVGRNGAALDVSAYPVGEDDRRRLIFETPHREEDGRRSIFYLACETWFQVDNYRYAGLAVDELVFVVADGGLVEGIWSPFKPST
jgi:hypothetical protein